MTTQPIEDLVRLAGGLAIAAALVVIFYGLRRGLQRPAGRTAGSKPGLLRSGAFLPGSEHRFRKTNRLAFGVEALRTQAGKESQEHVYGNIRP